MTHNRTDSRADESHTPETLRLLRYALFLSIFTIVYNLAEGLVSVYFGFEDETLSLFGFGVDSFVEVISGLGVGHMVWRMKKAGAHDMESHDAFERQALYITSVSFFLLTAGLVTGSIVGLIQQRTPETTFPGIVVSLISLASMWFLLKAKLSVGKRLDSKAIIADANCTKVCYYLSFILLASSFFYEAFRIPFIDLMGGLAIAYFSFNEGREAWEKARNDNTSCGCGGSCHTG